MFIFISPCISYRIYFMNVETMFYFFLLKNMFNWRIIALHYCVGFCHILTWISHVKCESHSVMSNSLQTLGLYSPWNSPGQNTGVGSCSLLQKISPNQGSNPCFPHCRQIVCRLSHHESPIYVPSFLEPFSQFPPNPTPLGVEGGGGTNIESSTETCTLQYVK